MFLNIREYIEKKRNYYIDYGQDYFFFYLIIYFKANIDILSRQLIMIIHNNLSFSLNFRICLKRIPFQLLFEK